MRKGVGRGVEDSEGRVREDVRRGRKHGREEYNVPCMYSVWPTSDVVHVFHHLLLQLDCSRL